MNEQHQREQNELMFIRNILCGMIEQAVSDCKNESLYKCAKVNEDILRDRESAVRFLRSRQFDAICDVLSLPADKIKTNAFTQQHPRNRPGNDGQRVRSLRPKKESNSGIRILAEH